MASRTRNPFIRAAQDEYGIIREWGGPRGSSLALKKSPVGTIIMAGTEMKRRGAIPKKEGSLLDNIYCGGCKADCTWVVHKVYNPAINMYAWSVTCLGCRFRSFEFAYEACAQSVTG
jgi:hypothetical protein